MPGLGSLGAIMDCVRAAFAHLYPYPAMFKGPFRHISGEVQETPGSAFPHHHLVMRPRR